MDLYEYVFKVTKTCQNGNEKTFNTSVFVPRFKMQDGRRVHVTTAEVIPKAKERLESLHYYNVECVGTKNAHIEYIEF